MNWLRTREKMTITSMRKVCILAFFVSGGQIQKFFDPKRSTNKMSSLLNVSNGSSKSEEFNLNNIEVFVDNKEQNWFKRARVGKFLGLVHIQRSKARLAGKDHKTRSSSRLKGGDP